MLMVMMRLLEIAIGCYQSEINPIVEFSLQTSGRTIFRSCLQQTERDIYRLNQKALQNPFNKSNPNQTRPFAAAATVLLLKETFR